MMQPTVICAANNEEVLRQNLLASPELRLVAGLHVEWNAPSSTFAYNRGIDLTGGDVLIFVHQDVYLPAGFFGRVERAIGYLDRADPNWGVLSCFGQRVGGGPAGRIWSSGVGRILGLVAEEPVQATAVDELLLIFRRSSGLRFDGGLPGFHCYAADLVATASKLGMRTYVADMPVVHNSQPVRRLDKGYVAAYRYMQQKWRSELPLNTLVIPVTRSGLALYRKRFRMVVRRCAGRTPFGYRRADPGRVAEDCGFVGDTTVPSKVSI